MQTMHKVDLYKWSKEDSKCWQRQSKLSAACEAALCSTFLSCVCEEAVCSLSACFRIMELCHILFKVRLIWGDSEPLICCHNADVFILSVTMVLLCVGLPRARCTPAWLVNQGSDSGRESWCKTKGLCQARKSQTYYTEKMLHSRCGLWLKFPSTVYMVKFNIVLRCGPKNKSRSKAWEGS